MYTLEELSVALKKYQLLYSLDLQHELYCARRAGVSEYEDPITHLCEILCITKRPDRLEILFNKPKEYLIIDLNFAFKDHCKSHVIAYNKMCDSYSDIILGKGIFSDYILLKNIDEIEKIRVLKLLVTLINF